MYNGYQADILNNFHGLTDLESYLWCVFVWSQKQITEQVQYVPTQCGFSNS